MSSVKKFGNEITKILEDDQEIILPISKDQTLSVWEDIEFIDCHISIDGTVRSKSASYNTDTADTDGNLCVYDAGSGAAIKNRLGSTKTIKYLLS